MLTIAIDRVEPLRIPATAWREQRLQASVGRTHANAGRRRVARGSARRTHLHRRGASPHHAAAAGARFHAGLDDRRSGRGRDPPAARRGLGLRRALHHARTCAHRSHRECHGRRIQPRLGVDPDGIVAIGLQAASARRRRADPASTGARTNPDRRGAVARRALPPRASRRSARARIAPRMGGRRDGGVARGRRRDEPA